jgi:hypothetical protein
MTGLRMGITADVTEALAVGADLAWTDDGGRHRLARCSARDADRLAAHPVFKDCRGCADRKGVTAVAEVNEVAFPHQDCVLVRLGRHNCDPYPPAKRRAAHRDGAECGRINHHRFRTFGQAKALVERPGRPVFGKPEVKGIEVFKHLGLGCCCKQQGGQGGCHFHLVSPLCHGGNANRVPPCPNPPPHLAFMHNGFGPQSFEKRRRGVGWLPLGGVLISGFLDWKGHDNGH